MVYLVLIPILLFSCTKDSDLFMDAVFNDPAKEFEERNTSSSEEDSDSSSEGSDSSSEEDSSESSSESSSNDSSEAESSSNEGDEMVTKTFTFSAIQDAHIDGSNGYNQEIMRLEEGRRLSFLMFDLSSIEGTIMSATLQFTVHGDNGDGTIMVEKAIPTDWTESGINASNAPVKDIEVGAIQKQFSTGITEKIELNSPDIQPEVTTFILKHKSGNDLAIASRENNSVSGPKLIVTYETYQGASDPDTGENASTDNTSTENNSSENNNTQDNASTGFDVDYYVSPNGTSSNDGRSEASAWSLQYAFRMAKAGDVIAVKAGKYNYQELDIDNSGTASNEIKFIGYRNVPGDINSESESSFKYGDVVNSTNMPLIIGPSSSQNLGVEISENHIVLENFQISNYLVGLLMTGSNNILRNVVVANTGLQSNNSIQGGRGMQILGDYNLIENSFILNSNGEGINIKGGHDCVIRNTKVYSDNTANPTGYYIAITHGGNNNIIDNCVVYRAKNADLHRGHGYVLKDSAFNNIIKNSDSHNTGIEVNFSGVHSNTFENMRIIGSYSQDSGEFSSNIRVINGAHDNHFKNIYIEDSRWAINFHDFNDGYANPNGDRDKQEGGSNNLFENITINGAKNIIGATSEEVGAQAFSNNNVFRNCTFKNITGTPFFSYQRVTNTVLDGCKFENISISTDIIKGYNGGSFEINFQNCTGL